MNNSITGILLAAGKSTRFGGNKLLAQLPDTNTPVAIQAANNLLESLPNSIAVVNPEDQELKALLAETGIIVIENPDAARGMSSSIRCTISYLNNNKFASVGCLIALADMPFISSILINQVANEIVKGELICAPHFAGKRGHPVGFSVQLMDELLHLQGDEGAKQIINRHSNNLKLIKSDNDTVLRDIDYPDDLFQ